MIAGFLEWLLIAAVRLIAQPRWLGCGPSGDQRIYVSNHTSHLDALLLLSTLPPSLRRRTRPVATAEYWSAGPVRRYVVQAIFRSVLVTRREGLLNPLEPVADALRQADSLLFFPEGTRGPGQILQPLKAGIFHLARWFPDIDIIPVWIDSSYRSMPKGFAIPLPLRCSITFGAPLRLKAKQGQQEFLAELRQALEALQP